MTTTWHEDGSTLVLTPKAAVTASAWRHHHILDLDDFTPDEIELVLHISGCHERSPGPADQKSAGFARQDRTYSIL